jgi:hypothetical protein
MGGRYMVLLVAERLDNFLVGRHPLDKLGVGLGHLQLALEEGLTLHLPLGLQSNHNVLVFPAGNLVSESAEGEGAELAASGPSLRRG